MKAIIIDDEEHCIKTLSWTLNEYCPEVKVIASANDGISGIEAINKYKPDLVFLDIEMPKLNGIDMLSTFEKINFKVIFTTAYDHYAIKAIKLSALDYLLKPVDNDELRDAVNRALANRDDYSQNLKLDTIKSNLISTAAVQKIAIPTNEGILFFDLTSIIHFEAQSNYTLIYFDDDSKLLSSKTLKEYEDMIPQDIFFRCHNSHIINLKFIKKYQKGDGGTIILTNNKEIEVSRRKKIDFMERMGL